jgi:hypothetical protein
MKSNSYLWLLLCAVLFGSNSVNSQMANFCGSTEAREKLLRDHPEILQYEEQLETETKQFEQNYAHFNVNRAGNIVIPIVFHIIHQGGAENISKAQVLDQVRILNEDFNKRNADTSQVIPVFKPIIADIGVEFRLANIDPNGKCTDGIDRIYSVQTYEGNDYSKLNAWPREKYLNVWVVAKMENGVAGYAYLPGSVNRPYNVPAMDGIIILSSYIGSIGSSSPNSSRALTHEIGHYLNLAHPWGPSNSPGVACGDDGVNDTPITKGSTSCNLGLAFCNSSIIENVQNFMDYSYCSKMFTEGQKIRMLAALNSGISQRNNLWSENNLIATGTDDDFYSPCAPKAAMLVNRRYICQGNTLTFKDNSYNGTVDFRTWSFGDAANPSVSNDSVVVVQFDQPGWQVITLEVENSLGRSTIRDSFFVFVAPNNALYQAPFIETFEDEYSSNNDWASVNYDNNLTRFKWFNSAAHTGSSSMQLNNFYSRAEHDIDELISPGFDLSNITPANMKLSFYYSLASSNTNFNVDQPDSLVVYATTNCGNTWTAIYKNGATSLINAGSKESYFVPTSEQAYWKYVRVNLNNSYIQPNVRFRFQVFSAVRGNNFYIDDINLGSAIVSGVEDINGVVDIKLFPNPSTGNAYLNMFLEQNREVTVKLFDVTGKEVLQVFDGMLNSGANQIMVPSAGLASGIYVVNIISNGVSVQKKFVHQ